MAYSILADLVVLIHFLWIVFLFVGALWGRRNRTIRKFHVGGLVFAVLIQLSDWYCPLTYLEVWLRAKQAPSLGYAGSFIVHYVERLVYLELSRSLVLISTLLLFGLNGWLYLGRKGQRSRFIEP